MIVIGGIYEEFCHEPEVKWVYGSGVRATVIARLSVEAFISVSEPESLVTARAVLGGDVEVQTSAREQPITFTYDTPISASRLYGQPKEQVVLPLVQAEQVLAFGMVEASFSVHASISAT